MSGASGRRGTSGRRYRLNRAKLLMMSDICGLCGHSGAMTADHIIPEREWPRNPYGAMLPGFDELENLQPAHGTMGAVGPHNPCPTCGKLCNQVKGDRPEPEPEPRSRRW